MGDNKNLGEFCLEARMKMLDSTVRFSNAFSSNQNIINLKIFQEEMRQYWISRNMRMDP